MKQKAMAPTLLTCFLQIKRKPQATKSPNSGAELQLRRLTPSLLPIREERHALTSVGFTSSSVEPPALEHENREVRPPGAGRRSESESGDRRGAAAGSRVCNIRRLHYGPGWYPRLWKDVDQYPKSRWDVAAVEIFLLLWKQFSVRILCNHISITSSKGNLCDGTVY